MPRCFVWLACGALLVASLPAAEARPGQGGSIGSRGARTYMAPPVTHTAPSGAQQIGRTVTPPRLSPSPAPSSRRRNLATGFLAGLIGVGVASLLAGHGSHHPMSWLGVGLELALFVGLVGWLVTRALRRPPRGLSDTPVLTRADRAAFETLLVDVQRAWTLSDIGTLTTLATPEMVGILNDQLRALAKRGARNSTSRVRLLAADLAEAWQEGPVEYATVAMRYRMIDITTDGTGRIIEGDPSRPQEVRETWTMLREGRSRWILSAIQQS